MRLFPTYFIQKVIRPFFVVFASTRGYTILVLVIAQYLSARYILAPHRSWLDHLTDKNLFVLVLASSFAIAGGYLINNFYDAEKDRINRPQQYLIHQILPHRSQLLYYVLFNGLCLILAGWVSLKTLLFFFGYISGIWLYSHVLKRTFWASNLFAAFLAIIPFFVISLYFDNLSTWVLYHAGFLFLIILIRDLVKDLENFKGDWVRKYNTVAIQFGVKTTKVLLTLLIALSFLPIVSLLKEKKSLGWMFYFFVLCFPYLSGIVVLLWAAKSQKAYLWLHNLLKFLILAGVGSFILVRFTS